MARDYRVGVVGCGAVGRDHARAYGRHDQTTVTAAADLDEATLGSFTEEFDVDAAYDDYEAMLANESIDVLSVCTWHSTHAEISVHAAEAGVDGIVCEKPMCTSFGEAEAMLNAARANETRLTVSTQLRYDPVHERARDLIADGAIGEAQTVSARADSGLLNLGTHAIDLTRYLLGDPELAWVMGQVERKTDRHERGVPIEDCCVGQICFRDGTRLTYEGDLPDPGRPQIRVSGSEGLLMLDLEMRAKVVNGDGVTEYAPESDRGTRLTYIDDLLEWIEDEQRSHRCRGEHARDTLEIQMSIYESVRTRGIVRAPLETRANPLVCMLQADDLPVEHPGKYDIRLPYSAIRGDDDE